MISSYWRLSVTPSCSERSLQKTNSSQPVKVLPADDTERIAHTNHSAMNVITPSLSYTEFEPPYRTGSPHSINKPDEREPGIALEMLVTSESPLKIRRFLLKLRKLAAERIQHLLTPISLDSNLSRLRSALLVFSYFAYVVTLPVELAFYSTAFKWLDNAGEAVAIMLLVDVILMFNTSFVDKRGAVVVRRWEIVAHYLKGSFPADELSSVAIYWLQSASNQPPDHVNWYYFTLEIVFLSHRIIYLLRALHIVWFGHAGRSGKSIWNWFLYSRYSYLIRISWIIGLVLLLAHYMACFWKMLQVDKSSGPLVDDYAESFYGALQLLQGQGLPTETVGQMFASFAVLAGSIVLAIVFGHVAMLVSNFNANTTNYQRKMESVFAITTKMQLPVPLQERIHQYYEHLWRGIGWRNRQLLQGSDVQPDAGGGSVQVHGAGHARAVLA